MKWAAVPAATRSLTPAFAGWNFFLSHTWGFARKASLHPRLHADACFAGYTRMPASLAKRV